MVYSIKLSDWLWGQPSLLPDCAASTYLHLGQRLISGALPPVYHMFTYLAQGPLYCM